MTQVAILQLLQLADSAFPIGAQAHSYGLETLAAQEQLAPEGLGAYLADYLVEIGVQEASFCRRGFRLAALADDAALGEQWLQLNQQISALRTAREGRDASAALGRRFLTLAGALTGPSRVQTIAQTARQTSADSHYAAAFGLAAGTLGLDEDAATLALLQQSAAGLLAAAQKLLPVGQSWVMQLLWQLKPTLIAAAEQSRAREGLPRTCAVMADLAQMRHANLPVRLFIS